jgi:hypothetical protein
MDQKSKYAIYKALLQAERMIELLDNKIVRGEKHSEQTRKMVKIVLKDIEDVKYCFID